MWCGWQLAVDGVVEDTAQSCAIGAPRDNTGRANTFWSQFGLWSTENRVLALHRKASSATHSLIWLFLISREKPWLTDWLTEYVGCCGLRYYYRYICRHPLKRQKWISDTHFLEEDDSHKESRIVGWGGLVAQSVLSGWDIIIIIITCILVVRSCCLPLLKLLGTWYWYVNLTRRIYCPSLDIFLRLCGAELLSFLGGYTTDEIFWRRRAIQKSEGER